MKSLQRSIFSMILLLIPAAQNFAAFDASTERSRQTLTVEAEAACDPAGEHFSYAAITWSPVEVECPVCKTRNIFLQWNSYGSYLADKAHEGRRKELLYISGAMRHFLRDDAGALKDFEEAKKLKFSDKSLSAEDNEGFNGYISKLIDEYIEMLRKNEGPRTRGASDSH